VEAEVEQAAVAAAPAARRRPVCRRPVWTWSRPRWRARRRPGPRAHGSRSVPARAGARLVAGVPPSQRL